MPPSEGRAGNPCVYVLSCFFFVLLTVGGALLVLYVALPEADSEPWFPIAGMVLVATPWLFWILTCVYRCLTLGFAAAASAPDRPLPVRSATVAPASASNTWTDAACADDSAVDSPRRVRFGVATVMGNQEAAAAGGAGANAREADGDAHADEGSSLTSHESERPLAYSMS